MEKRNKKILGYDKFLEEVSIEGNPGIPGEGDERPGERNYLRDITKRASDRLGVTPNDTRQMARYGRRLMSLVNRSGSFVNGNEKALGELAEKVIRHYYADIIDGVELDVKIGGFSDIARLMDELDEFDQKRNKKNKKNKEKPEDSTQSELAMKNDLEMVDKIHKAKIANIITQGEAKNTKHIMHMEVVKDGLKEIYGDRADEVLDIWVELTNVADKMDWLFPLDSKAMAMNTSRKTGIGFAGAVNVMWQMAEKEDDDDEDGLIGDRDDDPTRGGLVNDKDFEYEEEGEKTYIPVIKARGVDFPMLLHETVKGIYELLSAVMQPDEATATEEDGLIWDAVMLNVSSFEDEVEDFRTGPEIAADLRDFIFSIEGSDYHPNMREYVYAKMIDPEYFDDKEFLEFFRAILNNEDRAKRKMKELIDEVITFLKDYDYKEATGGWDEDSDDNYDDNYDDNSGDDSGDDIAEINLDYSEMNINQLEKAMMDAVDREDYEEAAIIKNIIDAR